MSLHEEIYKGVLIRPQSLAESNSGEGREAPRGRTPLFDPATVPAEAAECSLVSAYRSGRLLARLRFHMLQADFLLRNHQQDALILWRQLARTASRIVSERFRLSVRDRLISALHTWAERFDCTHYGIYVADACGDQLCRGHVDEVTEIRFFRNFLKGTTSVLDGISRAIEEQIHDLSHLNALRLGVSVEQGICPPEIYRHFRQETSAEASARIEWSREQHLREWEAEESVGAAWDPEYRSADAYSDPVGSLIVSELSPG